MKKQILIIILVMLVLLSACSQNGQNVKEPSPTQNDDIIPSGPIPTQPIRFENLDEAIKFIKEPDLSEYHESEHSDYYEMIDAFKSDGYITTVSHSVAERNINVSLYPEAKYEDIGVSYWFDLNGAMYQVLVYNTKAGEDFLLDKNTDTIIDYYKIRYDVTMSDYEIIKPDHEILSSMVFQLVYNGTRFGAKALIDNNHYIIVRAFIDQVNQSEFIEFIEGLELGQMII